MVEIKSNQTSASSHASAIQSAGAALGAVGPVSLDGQSILSGNSRLAQAVADNQKNISELQNLLASASKNIHSAAQAFEAVDQAGAATFKD